MFFFWMSAIWSDQQNLDIVLTTCEYQMISEDCWRMKSWCLILYQLLWSLWKLCYWRGKQVCGSVSDRRLSNANSVSSRPSPRPSISTDTVESTAQLTFRKLPVPVPSTERRPAHAAPAAVATASATAANAVAATPLSRVHRPKLAVAESLTSAPPCTASPPVRSRNAPRSNRSIELRMARRDTATSSKPQGQSLTVCIGLGL